MPRREDSHPLHKIVELFVGEAPHHRRKLRQRSPSQRSFGGVAAGPLADLQVEFHLAFGWWGVDHERFGGHADAQSL